MTKAKTVKTTFSRETSVAIEINANPSIIWGLLTNASNYSKWNSTVISIDGDIKPRATIKLKSTLDPKRSFKLKVKEFVPDKKLVWGDGMGNRVYNLTNGVNGKTIFSMSEKIGGPIFPLFAKYIPSFDESFEQFSKDLKKESENLDKTK